MVGQARSHLRAARLEYHLFARCLRALKDAKVWRRYPNLNGVVRYYSGNRFLENAPGDAAYRNFDHFCRGEFRMSGKGACDTIRVAEAFSVAEVERIGPTKLRAILRAPERRRGVLLRLAEKGATRAVIEAA